MLSEPICGAKWKLTLVAVPMITVAILHHIELVTDKGILSEEDADLTGAVVASPDLLTARLHGDGS